MASITSWNLDPNLQWFVKIASLTVTLFLSESDAVAGTNAICSVGANGTTGKVVFPATEFTYLGKTYDIEYYDDNINYHMQIVSGGTNIFRVGPFFELEAEEHAIYKDSEIAGSRALMLINQATHIQKMYTINVPGFQVYDAFSNVSVSSNRTSPNIFKGKIESISYELTRNSVVATLGVTKYERMSR